MKECKTKKSFAVREKRMLDSGITLIALVITIIILLILAGITINLALAPDGIVKRAQTAGDEYKDAQDKELSGLGKLENMINEISDKIAENNGITSGGGKDLSNVDKSVIALKAGDYIKYDTGDAEAEVAIFRVLYDLTSEHGLQIISNTGLETISIGGNTEEEARASYNGAIEMLNNATAKYLNADYASDTRCVGSIPTLGPDGKFSNKNNQNTNTIKMSEILANHTSDLSDKYGYDSSVGITSIAEGVNDDTGFFGRDDNYVSDITALRNFANDSFFNYEAKLDDKNWCASRTIIHHATGEGGPYLGLRSSLFVTGDYGVGPFWASWRVENGVLTEASIKYGFEKGRLCPVIALKYNDIKITGGNGSEGTPYEIGLK